MTRTLFTALLLAAAAPAVPGSVWAQVAGPTPGQIVSQQQANQNRFQAQLQAEQLQQLQRQNSVTLQQPDPNLQTQAAIRQQQIQQQIDQNTALQQQMLSPSASPADIHARIQQNDAQIRRLEQQQQAVSPADAR